MGYVDEPSSKQLKESVKFIPFKHIGVLALFPDPFNIS